MRIRITSNGTRMGTRVFDAETGELIKHATGIEFRHDAGGLPVVVLTLTYIGVAAEVDVLGEMDETIESVLDGTVVLPSTQST